MEEAGFLFEFTLSAEEALRARRRAQYFGLGHGHGVAVYCVMIGIFATIEIIDLISYALSWQQDGSDLVGAALQPVFMAIVLAIAWYAAAARGRPIVPDGAFTRALVCEAGIWIGEKVAAELHGWKEFTALAWTQEEYLVMTQRGYLPLPKRFVPAAHRREFEMFVRGMCIKQGKMEYFPVVMEPPTTEESQTRSAPPEGNV